MAIYLIKSEGEDDVSARGGEPMKRWSAEVDETGRVISMSKLLAPDQVRRLFTGPDVHVPATGWDLDRVNEDIRSGEKYRFTLSDLIQK